MADLIDRQAALDTIMGQPPEPHYPSWYAAQIEKLPAAQPATNCSEIPNSSDDTISRQAAIDAIGTLSDSIFKNVEKGATYPKRQWFDGMANAESIIKDLPSVLHPEIIRCEDCIHYNKHKDCIKYQRDGFCSEWARNTYKYWYCSRAERETDD